MHDSMQPETNYKINIISRITDYALGNIEFMYSWYTTPTISFPDVSRRILQEAIKNEKKVKFFSDLSSKDTVKYIHRFLTMNDSPTTP